MSSISLKYTYLWISSLIRLSNESTVQVVSLQRLPEMTKTYHARLFMKQGYYSYQYLMKMEDGSIRLLPSEGNFYQTQNKYNVLVYYRAQSDRTDRLVGYGELK